MNDDNDEIVEEVPVYLSKSLAENLFVLQYPNVKYNLNLEKAQVVNSRVKPINQEFKLDFALDTASRHYDAFKGEQLAIAADGKHDGRNDKLTFRSGTMDRQSFISTKPLDNVSKYVVGYLKDKEIHASIIKGVIQMRPSFSYFDKSDKRNKAELKAETEADLDDEEPKQVTVKFARTENDRIRKAREKSYNYITQKSAEEAWHDTMWYPKDSTEAELERRNLFSSSNESTGHALSLTSNEYIESLIPPENQHCSLEPRVICKSKLKTMSLEKQIQNILKDCKVVPFNKFLEFLDLRLFSADKILRTLQAEGVLLQGNWVSQSEKLYLPDSVSGTNGVPAQLMCRARDYILYLFYRNERIDREKISNITQIPMEEVKEILLTVAMRIDKQWQLVQPPNPIFEQQHEELKQRQDAYWRAKESSLYQRMELEERSREDKSPRRKRKLSERTKI